jgi:hypothetical protein
MADFLTRLAERTLGVAQLVQPIIAPIFAPEPAPTREVLTVQHEERALEAPTAEADQSVMGDGSSPSFLPAEGRSVPIHRPLHFNQDVYAHPERVKYIVRGASTDQENLTRSNVPAVESGIVPAQDAAAPTPSIVPSTTIPGPTSNAASPDTYLPTNWTPFTRTDSEALQALQQREASVPSIRVTIGRIEVRAIMPAKEPAARPPTRRPGPKLSLDDYLKQQNGGQR